MSVTWTASARSLRGFEILNIGLWLLTAALIATAFNNDRNYWILLLSWTAVFPFSTVADEYALLIRYNPGFRMLFWRCPVMIPFAFGWFFTLPLILVWQSGIIAQLPLMAQAGIVFLFFIAWGFFVEVASASSNLYLYRWPKQWKIGGMPWPVAVIDGVVHTLTFLLFPIIARFTANMSWPPAVGLGILTYVAMFVAFASFNWFVIKFLFRVKALPV